MSFQLLRKINMSWKQRFGLIKRDIEDLKSIHGRIWMLRLETTDVSNGINRMLAVHEEKLTRQEEEKKSMS